MCGYAFAKKETIHKTNTVKEFDNITIIIVIIYHYTCTIDIVLIVFIC